MSAADFVQSNCFKEEYKLRNWVPIPSNSLTGVLGIAMGSDKNGGRGNGSQDVPMQPSGKGQSSRGALQRASSQEALNASEHKRRKMEVQVTNMKVLDKLVDVLDKLNSKLDGLGQSSASAQPVSPPQPPPPAFPLEAAQAIVGEVQNLTGAVGELNRQVKHDRHHQEQVAQPVQAGQTQSTSKTTAPSSVLGYLTSDQKKEAKQRLPREMVKLLDKQKARHLHLIQKAMTGQRNLEKGIEQIGIMSRDPKRYPPGVRPYNMSIDRVDLDQPLQPSADQDHILSLTFKRGITRREAIAQMHQWSMLNIKSIDEEGRCQAVLQMKAMATKPKFMETCSNLAQTVGPTITLQADEPLPLKNFTPDHIQDYAEHLYHELVEELKKKEQKKAEAQAKAEEKEKKAQETLTQTAPDILLENFVKKVVREQSGGQLPPNAPQTTSAEVVRSVRNKSNKLQAQDLPKNDHAHGEPKGGTQKGKSKGKAKGKGKGKGQKGNAEKGGKGSSKGRGKKPKSKDKGFGNKSSK